MISSEDKFKAIEKIHNTRLDKIDNKIDINKDFVENIIDFILSGQLEENVEGTEDNLINLEFVSVELEKELGNQIDEHWNKEYIEKAYAKHKLFQVEMWEIEITDEDTRKFETIYLYDEKDNTYVLYEITFEDYKITIKIIADWFIFHKNSKLDMAQIWNRLGCYDLTEIDTIGNTDYSRTFMSSNANTLDISTWDFRNIEIADGMFQFAKVDTIIFPDMKYINFDNLKSIKYIFADIQINDEETLNKIVMAYNRIKCKNRKFIEDFEALSPQRNRNITKLDKTCYESLEGSRHCMKNINVGVVAIHDFNEIMEKMFIDTLKEWGECDKQTIDKLEHIGENKIYSTTVKPLNGLEHIQIKVLDLREIKISRTKDFYKHSYYLQNLNKEDEEKVNRLIKHMYYYILIHMIPSIKGICNKVTRQWTSNIENIYLSDKILEEIVNTDIITLNKKLAFNNIVHVKKV